MIDRAIEQAHRRMAEQFSSDERVLGAAPGDVTEVLLHWALDRLAIAARTATNIAAFNTAAEAIRLELRRLAEQAAAKDETPEVWSARLRAMPAGPPPAPSRPDAAPAAVDRQRPRRRPPRRVAPRDGEGSGSTVQRTARPRSSGGRSSDTPAQCPARPVGSPSSRRREHGA